MDKSRQYARSDELCRQRDGNSFNEISNMLMPKPQKTLQKRKIID